MNKKKVLLVATVQSHIAQFHKPLIKMLQEDGYEIDVAARDNLKEKNGLKIENVNNIYDIPFSRNPISKNNIKAYKELKSIVLRNQYDIIHCNTPMGGVITRLVKKNCKQIVAKIIYTAHGFHFYKGGPIKNWILYYPIEKFLSHYTDVLITINEEDYQIALNKFKTKFVYKINSTGISLQKFQKDLDDEEKIELQKSLNIEDNNFVILCIGELNKNKNQLMQIKAMEILIKEYPNIKLFLVGNGPLKEFYEKEIQIRSLENNIFLLGYRTDINKLLKMSNLVISTSIREGLPINILEAMSSGNPVIVTSNRGHREIISNENDGFIIELGDYNELVNKIKYIIENKEKRNMIIEKAKETVKKYSEDVVSIKLKEIYQDTLND